jgi:hypothetical protein
MWPGALVVKACPEMFVAAWQDALVSDEVLTVDDEACSVSQDILIVEWRTIMFIAAPSAGGWIPKLLSRDPGVMRRGESGQNKNSQQHQSAPEQSAQGMEMSAVCRHTRKQVRR